MKKAISLKDENKNKIRNFSAKTETTITSNQYNIMPDIEGENSVKNLRQNNSEVQLLNELSFRTIKSRKRK